MPQRARRSGSILRDRCGNRVRRGRGPVSGLGFQLARPFERELERFVVVAAVICRQRAPAENSAQGARRADVAGGRDRRAASVRLAGRSPSTACRIASIADLAEASSAGTVRQSRRTCARLAKSPVDTKNCASRSLRYAASSAAAERSCSARRSSATAPGTSDSNARLTACSASDAGADAEARSCASAARNDSAVATSAKR